MHSPSEGKPPLVADIEAALDALLAAVIADELRPRRRREAAASRAKPLPFTSVREIDAREGRVRSLIGEPIGRACREQIRALGQFIFDLTGSTAGMRAVLERVAERDPRKAGRRAAILDTSWSGAGQPGKDLWFA